MLLAEDIYKKFAKPVLKGVSCKILPGEIVGIAGENGSGKSTLLAILAGLIKPDAGIVSFEEQVGYVPQEAALFDNLSVRDNLRFWSAAHGLAPGRNIETSLPMDADFLKKKVCQLSGGMKKRLSIALACLHEPRWLIMDEPSAALDIGFKGSLFELLTDARGQGKGIIFSSHQPDELLWCDRIYILRSGVFVYEGDPRGLDDLPGALYGKLYKGSNS